MSRENDSTPGTSLHRTGRAGLAEEVPPFRSVPDQEMRVESEKQTIRLDQFLKWMNVVVSGGEAKHLIQAGEVVVNGEVETRRSRKLRDGDRVAFMGRQMVVALGAQDAG